MTTGETPEALIGQATDWLLRLEERPDDHETRAAAAKWRAENRAHAQAWARAERAYRLLVDTARLPAAQRAPQGGPWTRVWATGLAALAACLLLLYVPGLMMRLNADMATGTAELRDENLEDGSTVQLAPQTALDVRFTPARRSVTLLSGEAFFEVVSQPARPFEVRAGNIAVTVVGTAFTVRLSEDALTVAVQHGAVDLRSVQGAATPAQRLAPGDRVTIDRHNGVVRRDKVAVEEIAMWRDRRLFVEGATVSEVVGELRRYGLGSIVFTDRSLSHRQVTGLYDLRDPDRALRALVGPFGGQVREFTPLLNVVSGP